MSASPGLQQWSADIAMSEEERQLHDSARLTDPSGAAPVHLMIFISCYNEAPYIIGTLDTVRAAAHEAGISFEIIVIDDGSRDNTRIQEDSDFRPRSSAC